MKPVSLSDKIKKQEKARKYRLVSIAAISGGAVILIALFTGAPAISTAISTEFSQLTTPGLNPEAAVAASIATTTLPTPTPIRISISLESLRSSMIFQRERRCTRKTRTISFRLLPSPASYALRGKRRASADKSCDDDARRAFAGRRCCRQRLHAG